MWKLGAISPLFHNIFNISLSSGVKFHIYLLNVVVKYIGFLTSATLIFRGTDISKCYRGPLGIRYNESRPYLSHPFAKWKDFFFYQLMENSCTFVFNANSVDQDQRLRSAASDLGLHCLPMSLLWNVRLKWFNSFHSNLWYVLLCVLHMIILF